MPNAKAIVNARLAGLTLALILAFTPAAISQTVAVAELHPADMPMAPAIQPNPAFQPAPPVRSSGIENLPLAPSEQHKFWDAKNAVLFAAVAGMSGADFAATHANLQKGGRELNPVTRLFSGSTAGLAANFAGETAGVVGLSYFFHRTGHHKLERLTPVMNLCASGAAVAYSFSHR